jgi:hypothetical protein
MVYCPEEECELYNGLYLPKWNAHNALIRAARGTAENPLGSVGRLIKAVRAFDKAFKVEGKG